MLKRKSEVLEENNSNNNPLEQITKRQDSGFYDLNSSLESEEEKIEIKDNYQDSLLYKLLTDKGSSSWIHNLSESWNLQNDIDYSEEEKSESGDSMIVFTEDEGNWLSEEDEVDKLSKMFELLSLNDSYKESDSDENSFSQ